MEWFFQKENNDIVNKLLERKESECSSLNDHNVEYVQKVFSYSK